MSTSVGRGRDSHKIKMPLFAFGSNGAGQLGIGHQGDVPAPTLHIRPSDLQSESPACVTAGGSHTLVLYETGKVTITAADDSGENHQLSQTRVMADNVKFCSATWEASILCSLSNQVAVYGRGNKGELGQGLGVCETSHSGRILDLSPVQPDGYEIVDLASSVQHSVIVLSNGDVIGWGNGRKGQLGSPADIVWKPRKIDGVDFHVRRAVCGRDFTYLVGDATKGQHLILGTDKWQLKSDAPFAVPNWKDIGASWGSIFVLLDSGSILSWGRHDHGQLAPQNIPRIEQIAIGSEHALALGSNGQVLAWGWGEHGNCGPDTDDEGDVKGRWNVIAPSKKSDLSVKGVGAGCATSWIWG